MSGGGQAVYFIALALCLALIFLGMRWLVAGRNEPRLALAVRGGLTALAGMAGLLAVVFSQHAP